MRHAHTQKPSIALVEQMVPQAVGTIIGNFSDSGTQALPWDGITYADTNNSGLSGADGWVGKKFATAKLISKIRLYPSNNYGFTYSGNPTIDVYSKATGTATSSSDGSVIHSVGTITDQTTMLEIVFSSPVSTENLFVRVQGGIQNYMTEMELFELV